MNLRLDRLELSKRSAAATAVLALLPLVAACSHSRSPTDPGGPGGGPVNNLPLQLSTEHFVLHYSTPSTGLMSAYSAALEQNWRRITRDLGQSSVPPIDGFFYPDRSSFTAATGYADAGGSVEGPNRFHVVAIPLTLDRPVHEFAHNVTLHLAPAAGDNPIWLWEAVAVYESGELVPPASLPYLAAGNFPHLSQLQRGGQYSIYDVGYTLAELIVEDWGFEGLRALIVSHGDIEGTLGISTEEFERRWREFVQRRYL
jgi:hypothetical protein